MAPDRIYRHFCMTARALEVVGERWSLLIVRDLLVGPRRFTDLSRGLDEITPSRLTGRLRTLEAAGVIAREPPQAGREVWYRLTEAGRDLGPVIDALTLWGIKHAREAPLAGEPVHAEPVMTGTKAWLNAYAPKAPDGLAWGRPLHASLHGRRLGAGARPRGPRHSHRGGHARGLGQLPHDPSRKTATADQGDHRRGITSAARAVRHRIRGKDLDPLIVCGRSRQSIAR
jgi:DNA-binding HxlR family transcriptional regulator